LLITITQILSCIVSVATCVQQHPCRPRPLRAGSYPAHTGDTVLAQDIPGKTESRRAPALVTCGYLLVRRRSPWLPGCPSSSLSPVPLSNCYLGLRIGCPFRSRGAKRE